MILLQYIKKLFISIAFYIISIAVQQLQMLLLFIFERATLIDYIYKITIEKDSMFLMGESIFSPKIPTQSLKRIIQKNPLSDSNIDLKIHALFNKNITDEIILSVIHGEYNANLKDPAIYSYMLRNIKSNNSHEKICTLLNLMNKNSRRYTAAIELLNEHSIRCDGN